MPAAFLRIYVGQTIDAHYFVLEQFDDEGNSFLENKADFDFGAQNITIPGASPQFPYLHCTSDGDACLVTLGEGMTNAGNTVMALLALPVLNLTKTYFVTGGVAGGNPKVVSSASVIRSCPSARCLLSSQKGHCE